MSQHGLAFETLHLRVMLAILFAQIVHCKTARVCCAFCCHAVVLRCEAWLTADVHPHCDSPSQNQWWHNFDEN